MTATATTQATSPPTIAAEPGSRLEQLQAAYADAKAVADDAAKKLKAITDAIKVELTTLAPEGSEAINLAAGVGPALKLSYVESWRLDSTRLKKDDPETWVRYAKKSGSWTLKQVGGQGSGGDES